MARIILATALLLATATPIRAQDSGEDPATEDAVDIQEAPAVGVWDRLAQCESHGDWTAVSRGGLYWGGLQFDLQTWRAYGGVGLPSQTSRAGQIAVAERLRAARGYQPWPVCSRIVGLT